MKLSKIATVGILLFACTATKALAWWNPFQSDQETFLLKCEDTFENRIKSPASYKRVEVIGPLRHQAELNDYLGRETPEIRLFRDDQNRRSSVLKDIDAAYRKRFRTGDYEVISFSIMYDADNSYGTAIRGVFTCSQVVETAADLDPNSISGPKVDNLDAIGWIGFTIWQQNQ